MERGALFVLYMHLRCDPWKGLELGGNGANSSGLAEEDEWAQSPDPGNEAGGSAQEE